MTEQSDNERIEGSTLERRRRSGDTEGLVRLLDSNDPAIRGEAADALVAMNGSATPCLVEAVRSGRGRQPLLALHTLVRIGGDAARGAVVAVLDESVDTNLLHAAIDGCAQLGVTGAIPALRALATGRDSWIRLASIQALCSIAGPETLDLVQIDSHDDVVLECVIDSARSSADPAWILPLLEIVSGNVTGSTHTARRDAASAMVSILEATGDVLSLETARRLALHLEAESAPEETEQVG